MANQCCRSFRAELFAGAPDFPPFEVDGAIATLSDDRPEHLNEQINGVTFAGIRRFYLIYPEQPGKFPSVAISVPYASHPPETTNATLTLKPRNFTSALPPGAEGLDYFLPTSQLTLRQQWSAPLNHLHVGDAVSRTIVVTAQKMQAMLIPPAKFPAPDGIRVYPKEPSVENTKGPIGEFLAGVRTEQASYLFTKPGDCTIPAVEITWWDQKPQVARLKATGIHVDAADSYVSELPPQPPAVQQASSRNLRSYFPIALKSACALLILAGLAVLLYKIGPLVLRTAQSARDHWQNSERAHFQRLTRALRRNDASHSYSLLLSWIHRANKEASLHTFLQNATDPQLDQQILALSRSPYTSPQSATAWTGGSALLALLSRHRHVRAAQASRSAPGLPPLNPI